MSDEHIDRALAEEFAGHSADIRRLKVQNAHFRTLMERNHAIWTEIQNIQSGVTPASDEHLEMLEKQRLKLLDEIARRLSASMV